MKKHLIRAALLGAVALPATAYAQGGHSVGLRFRRGRRICCAATFAGAPLAEAGRAGK